MNGCCSEHPFEVSWHHRATAPRACVEDRRVVVDRPAVVFAESYRLFDPQEARPTLLR